MTTHVPAWKRLGLTLKNEEDVNATASSTIPIKTSKKRKSSSEVRVGKENNDSHVIQINGANNGSPNSVVGETKVHEPAPKKRKSVSFTDDVKHVDGPSEIEDRSEVADMEGNADSKAKPKRKKPKERKPRTAKASTALDEDTTRRPYLEYLDNHYRDKASWKFNKNQQTQLIKNVFNIFRISAKYDVALVDYITGLHGANVRSRLKSDAEIIVSNSGKGSADDADLGQIGEENETSGEAGDDGDNVAAMKTARAKAVLTALAVLPPPVSFTKPDSSNKDTESAQALLKPKRKTRGRRKRVNQMSDSDSDSSSSSSSSESSEDDSSDDET